MVRDEQGLQYLLDLNGETIAVGDGCVARFKAVRTEPTAERPHGISYSLTLHAPDGSRILGFDNAHGPGR